MPYADPSRDRHGVRWFWWVLVPLFLGFFFAVVGNQEVVRPSPEHWVLRVTTTGGIVIDEAQGQGCAVGQYTARVWVGRGNTYDNVTYRVTNNAPNVILSCMRLK